MARAALALAALALVCGCGTGSAPAPGDQASSPAPATAAVTAAPAALPAVAPALAIEGEGLRLFDAATGRAVPLAFGTEWQAALRMLAFRGAPRTGSMDECGAGPLIYAKWPDSLTLYGEDGRFTGWFVDASAQGALATAAGIGPGSTRQELDAAYDIEVFESTLGTEFAAGGLFGLLDGTHLDSPVTHMWAGTSCNFH